MVFFYCGKDVSVLFLAYCCMRAGCFYVRAVTRERYASFAAKNLESPPHLMQSARAIFPLFVALNGVSNNKKRK